MKFNISRELGRPGQISGKFNLSEFSKDSKHIHQMSIDWAMCTYHCGSHRGSSCCIMHSGSGVIWAVLSIRSSHTNFLPDWKGYWYFKHLLRFVTGFLLNSGALGTHLAINYSAFFIRLALSSYFIESVWNRRIFSRLLAASKCNRLPFIRLGCWS